MEPDDGAGGAEALSVDGAEDCATAGSDDCLIFLEEFSEDVGFQLSERSFSVAGKDFRDGSPGLLFDGAVGIEPIPAKFFSEARGDAGFSACSIADK